MKKCQLEGFPVSTILALVILLPLFSLSPTAAAQESEADTSGCDEVVGIGSGGMSFENRTVSIEPGQTVCWIWTNETMAHNVAQTKDSSENTRMLGGVYSGEPNITVDFRHTFEGNQTFYYLCEPHSAVMKGAVIVGSGDSAESGSSQEADSTPGFSTAFALLSLTAAVAFSRSGRP